VKITSTPRETRNCAARVGPERVRRASRLSGRCGAAALDYGDVRIAGRLVGLPLCQEHFRKLRDSPDPLALASAWAPDLPEGRTQRATAVVVAASLDARPGRDAQRVGR
jgi:hypothetical protein